MADRPILQSKIQIPVPTRYQGERPRVSELLEQEIPSHKLTLVSAPAGYGKTSALADWARSTRVSVAWFTASGDEAGTVSVLRHLLAAWETRETEMRDSPLDVLLGSRTPDIEQSMALFLNTAANRQAPIVFVIDDYHRLQETAFDATFESLIEHAPAPLHWVIAGRTQPKLAIARYRARGDLSEIGAEALSFDLDETEAFLRRFGLNLAAGETEKLQQATEGWAAALQLAGLGQQRSRTQPIPPLDVNQRFIAEYLEQEVFAQLPDDMRGFLRSTSILERLNADLCDAVTDGQGSQAMLASLERDGLFTEPLDQSGEWYRYHALFRDFLQRELGSQSTPEAIRGLHARAAHWLAQQDLAEPAFRHAIEGLKPGLIIEICERHVPRRLLMGDFNALQAWFDSIPDDWYESYPILATSKAGFLLQSGALEAALAWLDRIDDQLAGQSEAEHRWIRARTTAARCGIACFRNELAAAESLANRALNDLPQDDVFFQAMICIALGDTYRKNAEWQRARDSYAKVLRFADAPLFHQLAIHVYGALADLDMRRGALRQAASSWKKALSEMDNVSNWGGLPLPLTGWIYIRLAEILLEWNALDQASSYLEHGLQRAELGGDTTSLIAGHLAACRLGLAQHEVGAASSHWGQARGLLDQAPYPERKEDLLRLQVELWLAQGDRAQAESWANAQWKAAADGGSLLQLAVARAWLSAGNRTALKQVRALLSETEAAGQREGRVAVEIQAGMIKALAAWQLGDKVRGLTEINHPLHLAESEDYRRTFIALGLPMARLLQEADRRGALSAFGQGILANLQDQYATDPLHPSQLPEPLSDREVQVLELVAAGLTNQETADRLVISSGTVKKHLSNIYGKLGVSGRTRAAATARQLGLIK